MASRSDLENNRGEPDEQRKFDYVMCDLDAAYADAGRGPISERGHGILLKVYPDLHRKHMEGQIDQMERILLEAGDGTEKTARVRLAEAVLTMAANGAMPDSFWLTDERIALAAKTLELTPEEARDWAREECP